MNGWEIEERYRRYLEYVSEMMDQMRSYYAGSENKVESDWQSLKQRYGIKDNRTVKELLQEAISTPSNQAPSNYMRNSFQEVRYSDIHANERYIENRELKDGNKFGVEQENATIDNLIKNAGKILSPIASGLIVKKKRGEDKIELSLENPGSISAEIQSLLENEINKGMQQHKNKFYGSQTPWEAVVSVQSITKGEVTNVDHVFVFDILFGEQNSGRAPIRMEDVIPSFMVEEKNVSEKNLPKALIENFRKPQQWKWKYRGIPYYIYKHKIFTATEMLDEVERLLKNRNIFWDFITKK